MRPLFVVLLAVLVFAGVGGYLKFAGQITPPAIDFNEDFVAGDYRLELVATFPMRASPFELEPAAVTIRFRGQEILREGDDVPTGTKLVVEPLEEVATGKNEFFVKASAGGGDALDDTFGNLSSSFDTSSEDFSWSPSEEGDNSDAADGEAVEPTSVTVMAKAIQLTLFRGDVVLGQQVLWSEGPTVEGVLVVSVLPEPTEVDHH